MEDSFLFDLLYSYSADYYNQLRKEDDFNVDIINSSRAELEKALNSEQLKLVDSYKNYCDMREETLNIQLSIRLINQAVKMGMTLQKAIDKDIYE